MIKYIRKKIFDALYEKQALRSLKNYMKSHENEIDEMCRTAKIKLTKCDGEDAFVSKWSPLMKNVNVNFYRFYSHFIGNDPNILPDDLFHAIIDPIINDKLSLPVYLNKNMYEKLIDKDVFPICVLRNMNGDYLSSDYKDIKMTEDIFDTKVIKNERLIKQGRIIVKPTLETGRGKGVRLFSYVNASWVSDDGIELSLDFLNKEYFADFIIQECIEPSSFIKQFNKTSYSTCRIYTYRSVKDGAMHFLGGYLRIGDVGSFKDNIGSGGFAIPIMPNGALAHFASNGTRNRYEEVNGVNLVNNTFIIPNFDKVIALAFYGAEKVPLNRVLSFDIILDQYDMPHIIEFNLKCQTITTMQTTYKSFFGEFTDEIIEYCLNKINNNQLRVFPFYLSKNAGLTTSVSVNHAYDEN